MIYRMEKNKHLEPKFSMTLYPLLKFLKAKYINEFKEDDDGKSSIFS
jgi:hypothetical protein